MTKIVARMGKIIIGNGGGLLTEENCCCDTPPPGCVCGDKLDAATAVKVTIGGLADGTLVSGSPPVSGFTRTCTYSAINGVYVLTRASGWVFNFPLPGALVSKIDDGRGHVGLCYATQLQAFPDCSGNVLSVPISITFNSTGTGFFSECSSSRPQYNGALAPDCPSDATGTANADPFFGCAISYTETTTASLI